jgi:hypothetical protein
MCNRLRGNEQFPEPEQLARGLLLRGTQAIARRVIEDRAGF